MKNSITFILILTSFVAFSQNTVVSGNAENKPDKLVRIITYADGFSRLEQTIAQTYTDNSGNFSLNPEVELTQFAYLALELEKGEFYISPDAGYKFHIPADTSDVVGSVFDKLPLRFNLIADDRNIQNDIEDFNIRYNDFLYNNVNSIYRSRDKSVVTGFINEIKNTTETKSEFVKNYINYSLGYLSWLSKKENNQKILDNCFVNKPVLYNNIQYTDFFNEFFRSYFSSESTFRYEDLIPAINSKPHTGLLDDLISRDTLLKKDDRVKEIVSMLLLSRYYHDRYVKKESVITRLTDISENSKFSENRKIAGNYIIKLQELQSNTVAPEFVLNSINNTKLSIDSFKGKFLLLCFVVENCRICDFHKDIINDIHERSSAKFDILSIITGDDPNLTEYIQTLSNPDWQAVSLSDSILLLEDYNIETYPTYILINPDGTIAYAHLPMPDENMGLYIERFAESYSKRNK